MVPSHGQDKGPLNAGISLAYTFQFSFTFEKKPFNVFILQWYWGVMFKYCPIYIWIYRQKQPPEALLAPKLFDENTKQ